MKRRRAALSRHTRRDGTSYHKKVWCRWPHDTLSVGEWYEVENPDDWQSARNSAYQYGRRSGKTFTCKRVLDANARALRVLVIERIE